MPAHASAAIPVGSSLECQMTKAGSGINGDPAAKISFSSFPYSRGGGTQQGLWGEVADHRFSRRPITAKYVSPAADTADGHRMFV